MKKVNVKRMMAVLCLCIIATLPARSQWRFGVKAGLASTTVNMKDCENSRKLGLLAGGVATCTLSSSFDLQGELFYANRGFKTDIYLETDDTKAHDWTFSQSYLNMPLLLKWFPTGHGVYVEAGPQVGYLLDSDNDIEGWPKGEPRDELGWKKAYRRWDFGLVGGIGAMLNNRAFVDVRYNLGLTSMMKEPALSWKHRAWELSLGFMF